MRALLIFPLLLAASVASPGWAGPAVSLQPSAAFADLLDLSGAKRAFEQFPAQMDAQLSAGKKPIPEKLRAALKAAFSPAALTGHALASLTQNFERERVGAALAMLRSPIALKMTRLETEGSAPGVEAELSAFAQQVQTEMPPPARMSLVTRLDRLSGATEFSARIAAGAAMAVLRGLTAAQGAKLGSDGPTLGEMEAKLRGELRNHVLISLLFCYRSATDPELDEYARLLDSDIGRSTVAALMRAAEAAFDGCSKDLEKRLAASGSGSGGGQ